MKVTVPVGPSRSGFTVAVMVTVTAVPSLTCGGEVLLFGDVTMVAFVYVVTGADLTVIAPAGEVTATLTAARSAAVATVAMDVERFMVRPSGCVYVSVYAEFGGDGCGVLLRLLVGPVSASTMGTGRASVSATRVSRIGYAS